MSASDMTSTRASGCDLISVLLPIILAGMIIGVMLVMGHEAAPYSSPLRTLEPTEGSFYRLDCVVAEMDHGELLLCDEGKCLEASAPPEVFMQIKPGAEVIVSGEYRQGRLHVASVLTRCAHGKSQ